VAFSRVRKFSFCYNQYMYSRLDDHEDQHFEELLRYGITALKGGDRAQARRWLTKATLISLSDARPWLWLSGTTDDPAEQRDYLEKAVAADPSNASARRGLVMLSEKLDKSRLVPEGASVEPRRPTAPEEAQAKIFACPKCGGHLQFDIDKGDLACPYCGYLQVTEKKLAADTAEQPIDFVLPTTRAHRWAEAQQRLSCEHCGAVTLLPAGQRADHCPYCGSNRLVNSAESGELVDPQVIALLKVSEKAAQGQVRKWLMKGMFAPDDLVAKVSQVKLRPAYYPFWTFDGILEISWNCEVNEGTSKAPRWVPHSGIEFDLFDDILVPGLRSMSVEEMSDIEPFNLKEVVEFSPEFLAGWIALSYDLPLSDATLKAREKVITRLRRSLVSKVEPGREKRNLTSGGGKWSGLTFKYVLLPLWVGTYLYRGGEYRLLVNGQTGKVGGKKPRDRFKIWMMAVVFLLAVIFVAVIAYLLWLRTTGTALGG
jgi:DNA-directed RNA polymerase subunit RPC12/RpoP